MNWFSCYGYLMNENRPNPAEILDAVYADFREYVCRNRRMPVKPSDKAPFGETLFRLLDQLDFGRTTFTEADAMIFVPTFPKDC